MFMKKLLWVGVLSAAAFSSTTIYARHHHHSHHKHHHHHHRHGNTWRNNPLYRSAPPNNHIEVRANQPNVRYHQHY